MYKIFVSDKLPDNAIDLFQSNEKYELSLEYGLEPAEIKRKISPFHAIIVRSATTVSRDILDAAENLKVIGRAGSGLDNIDVTYANKKGIEVFNTPGSNSQAVAELTISLLLSLTRDLYNAIHSIKRGQWEKSTLIGHEISGKTLGLIGFGQIGQRVGQMAAGLGMRVLVYKNKPVFRSPGFEFEIVEFKTLLQKSDFISLHLPKNDQSTHLIGIREFEIMKPNAFLINCARGGIVNEQDLLSALDNKIIAGTGLDVYQKEPPTDFSLIRHPQVIATPHIGGSTFESQDRVGEDIAKLIMNYLEKNYLFI